MKESSQGILALEIKFDGLLFTIMSNIAEGFERGRAAEFHQFLSIAKASCAELRSQLYFALDAQYLNQEVFAELTRNAVEVEQIIGGFCASVEQRRSSS